MGMELSEHHSHYASSQPGLSKKFERCGCTLVCANLALVFCCRFFRLGLAAILSGSRDLSAFHFPQASSFAFEIAQIEELGAANAIRAQDLNLVDDFGVQREDALHSLAKADFTDG